MKCSQTGLPRSATQSRAASKKNNKKQQQQKKLDINIMLTEGLNLSFCGRNKHTMQGPILTRTSFGYSTCFRLRCQTSVPNHSALSLTQENLLQSSHKAPSFCRCSAHCWAGDTHSLHPGSYNIWLVCKQGFCCYRDIMFSWKYTECEVAAHGYIKERKQECIAMACNSRVITAVVSNCLESLGAKMTCALNINLLWVQFFFFFHFRPSQTVWRSIVFLTAD